MLRPVLLVLSILLSATPAGAVDSLPGPVRAEVLKVVDGDTLDVKVRIWLDQEVTTRVRLDGIDTPESRSRCQAEKDMARQARGRLESLVRDARSTVLLRDITHDKFGGRVRAKVVLADGTDIADALIREGHARRYMGGARQPWCPTAQVGERQDPAGTQR
ncbi:MAG: hypothetical protein RLY86_468 [Pseudomonadota bacterium]